ncbi:hypothetical protein [Methylobacterium sp. WL6]|uniref:hypothetical protein n=1 Tax=Methylobacterium sp. WL6 TaxID=2603901 RepID=UPI0011CC4A3C|nr:hypothetical protein [Methylobacterium sp. WL6]TXN71464.1 hypothetical protein FV230_08370 [Methylobacterium sp. WL6]
MRSTMLPLVLAPMIFLALIQAGGAEGEVDIDAAAREALFNKAEATEVSERLHADPRKARVIASCPADVFERERPVWRGLAVPQRPSERTCALHPADCYGLCVRWANGPACFDLAQAYEHHSLDVPDAFDGQRFHALACAMGYSAGCTNRAAGIRNGHYHDDTFRGAPVADKQSCEYRSFLLDCDRRGAWGCAMLGQSYRTGEGVAAQPQRARAAFEMSCEINPKFAACAFAKRQLEMMDPPPSAEDAGSDAN